MEIYRHDSPGSPAGRRGRPGKLFGWPLLDLKPGEAFDMPLALGKTWKDDPVSPSGATVSYLRVKASGEGKATGRKFSVRVDRSTATLAVIRVA